MGNVRKNDKYESRTLEGVNRTPIGCDQECLLSVGMSNTLPIKVEGKGCLRW